MDTSAAPAISIIIPTKGRKSQLENLLNSIRQQGFNDFEILIASPDQFANLGSNAKLIHQNEGGPSKARNLALREAQGELILFLDDDVELQNDYLSFLTTIMDANPEIAGIGGISTLPEHVIRHTLLPPLMRLFTGRELGSGEKIGRVLSNGFTAPNFEYATKPMRVEWLRGSNMAFRSQVTRRVGFFDENYEGNSLYEDADYGYRCTLLGYKLLLDPSLKQRHQSLGTPLYPEENYAYYMAYNQIYFFYKFCWDGTLSLARCLAGQLFQNLLYVVGGVIYKRPRAFRWHARGIIDGFARLQRIARERSSLEVSG